MSVIEINITSDEKLINLCIKEKSKEVWGKFYHRFNSFIDKHIIRVLVAYDYSRDVDTLDEIRCLLIDKLYSNKILEQCNDVSNFERWFGTVVKNHTKDWLKKRRKISNSLKIIEEKETISLTDPVEWDTDITYENIIPDTQEDLQDIKTELEDLLYDIEKMSDKYRLTLKIATIFYNSLSKDDIEKIAQMRGDTVKQVKKKIDGLMSELADKYQDLLFERNKVSIQWAYIRRLKARYYYLKQNSNINSDKLMEIEIDIISREKKVEKVFKHRDRYIRPTSKQITDLIGWDEKQVNTVNVLLHRAINSLKKERPMK